MNNSAPRDASVQSLADVIDRALPQTQCTRCGFPDCRAYATAIAEGRADINQCPPGGQAGIETLARLTGRDFVSLNPVHGVEAPRQLAVIDEAWCIGCTLCIKACPVDCIVGGPKLMHTVVDAQCTGCELCIPVCPVDCISLVSVTQDRTGWEAWSADLAQQSRQRYDFHRFRTEREQREQDERLARKAVATLAHLAEESKVTDPVELEHKRGVIEAALARSRLQRAV